MKMECVAHLTQSFGCGGLEKVIVNTINHSKHYPNTRHIVISLTDDVGMKSALPDYVEVISLGKKPGIDLKVHHRLFKLLKANNVTVFHTYNFCTIEYQAVAKACGIPRRIHADHGLGGDDSQGTNRKRLLLRRIMSQLIDKYVVVSDDLKKWVISSVGVSEPKVQFVFNGVTVHPNQPVNPANKKELSLVIIGRLAKVKNHGRLFEAISQFKRVRPDVSIRCEVVGEGPDSEHLKSLCRKLDLSENVKFCGLQMDVAPFLQKADGFILSSDYEAMPMTVLEAMASSRPVICPTVGGVTDFISDNEAILVEGHSADALCNGMLKLVDMDTDARQALANRGHEIVSEKYSMQSMVDCYFELYGISQPA